MRHEILLLLLLLLLFLPRLKTPSRTGKHSGPEGRNERTKSSAEKLPNVASEIL